MYNLARRDPSLHTLPSQVNLIRGGGKTRWVDSRAWARSTYTGGAPPASQLGGPPANQLEGPPASQLGSPPANQLGGLPANQLGGGHKPVSWWGPAASQLGGATSQSAGGPYSQSAGGPISQSAGRDNVNKPGLQSIHMARAAELSPPAPGNIVISSPLSSVSSLHRL